MKQSFSPLIYHSLAIIIAVVLLVAVLPQQGLAHPALGFTPTPEPEAETPTPQNIPPPSSPPSPTPLPHKISLSLGCDLVCPGEAQSISASIPVQLVHEGSGWIVDTTISNSGGTTLDVPYPGRWEVIMTGAPQVYPDLGVEFPTSYPVSLGTVESDGGNQSVSCPITPICDIPPVLPQTGDDDSLPYVLIISAFTLIALLGAGSGALRRARLRAND